MFTGEGCAKSATDAGIVFCPDPVTSALIVVIGRGSSDEISVDPSVPTRAQVRINGNAGSDSLVGGEGDDVLEAGENYNGPDDGNDVLVGNGGNDVLYADPGGDQLAGGPGGDLLVSSVVVCQSHRYSGGEGQDTVSYARSDAALHVALGGGGGPKGCGSLDEVLADNESLEGSDGPDTLIGDGGPNSFLGHLGADTFVGKGGSDFIDAVDGKRDKAIVCGGGDDEVLRDGADPSPRGC
jgi:Ca2+-binding RTX toxin-like protein